MQNYVVREYVYQNLKGKIALPKFQRSLVWKQENKEWFIETVLKGDPFGVLLIYNNKETDEQQIIDGLQRYSTLQDFEKNPFNYISMDATKFPEISKIVSYIMAVYPDSNADIVTSQITDIIKKIFSKHTTDELGINHLFDTLLTNDISKIYPSVNQNQEGSFIVISAIRLWDTISKTITISNITIPVIVYHGKESELPSIFERLNRGGTSLTKYEVFASSWSHVRLKHVDDKIAKIIEKRYADVMEKTQMQIDNFQEGDILASRDISLYEYCFALGKLIKENSVYIFGSKSRKDDAVDSVGFSVLASLLGLHLKDMVELKNHINEKISYKNLNKLTENVLLIFTILQSILKSYISNYSKYLEAQIISMAVTLFKIKFTIDAKTLEIEPVTGNSKQLDLFIKNAPFRYFNDMIRNFWSGSGDNKLFDIINSPMQTNRYLTSIDENTWRIHLRDWMNEQYEKASKTISPETKLFISFIGSPYFDIDNLNSYQMNHIIPKNTLKSKNIVFGISHVGNIYMMHSDLKQLKDRFLGYETLSNKQKLSVFNYPLNENIDFLNGLHPDLDYRSYLEKRTETLIEAFIGLF